MRDYRVGMIVVSRPVGCVGAFKGKIVRAYDEYVVRDEHGNEWCRTPSELMLPRGRKPKGVTHAGQ